MMTHWIIASGRPKLPVMSGKAMLTAVSSGTTEMPSPTMTRRIPSRTRLRTGTTALLSDVAPGSMARDERADERASERERRHNDRLDPQCQPRLRARRAWRRRHIAARADG